MADVLGGSCTAVTLNFDGGGLAVVVVSGAAAEGGRVLPITAVEAEDSLTLPPAPSTRETEAPLAVSVPPPTVPAVDVVVAVVVVVEAEDCSVDESLSCCGDLEEVSLRRS